MGMRLVGSNGSSRVVEPELDMKRRGPRMAARMVRLRDLLRVLAPAGGAMGPPMRSVDRELQEAWPSRDR
jgi:hypothetical protein